MLYTGTPIYSIKLSYQITWQDPSFSVACNFLTKDVFLSVHNGCHPWLGEEVPTHSIFQV
jgi:hypothetical protein